MNGDSVDSVTLTSTGAVAAADAGDYDIVISDAVGTGLGNYTIQYQNGTLTVNKADLTVTANDDSKTEGVHFSRIDRSYIYISYIAHLISLI